MVGEEKREKSRVEVGSMGSRCGPLGSYPVPPLSLWPPCLLVLSCMTGHQQYLPLGVVVQMDEDNA